MRKNLFVPDLSPSIWADTSCSNFLTPLPQGRCPRCWKSQCRFFSCSRRPEILLRSVSVAAERNHHKNKTGCHRYSAKLIVQSELPWSPAQSFLTGLEDLHTWDEACQSWRFFAAKQVLCLCVCVREGVVGGWLEDAACKLRRKVEEVGKMKVGCFMKKTSKEKNKHFDWTEK